MSKNQYHLKFSVTITDGVVYDPKYNIKIDVNELLPFGVDPESYVKKRLAEEVKRSFSNIGIPIENDNQTNPLEV